MPFFSIFTQYVVYSLCVNDLGILLFHIKKIIKNWIGSRPRNIKDIENTNECSYPRD